MPTWGSTKSCAATTSSETGRPSGAPVTRYRTITPDYFKVMGIALIHGRFFTEWDAHGSPKVVIINRADEARPQSVSLIDWNLKPTFKDSVFKFTPPKGATKVEIVPRKTK